MLSLAWGWRTVAISRGPDENEGGAELGTEDIEFTQEIDPVLGESLSCFHDFTTELLTTFSFEESLNLDHHFFFLPNLMSHTETTINTKEQTTVRATAAGL